MPYGDQILFMRYYLLLIIAIMLSDAATFAQQPVKVIKIKNENRIDVFISEKPFTSFIYPDSLEKPVLYPVRAANGTVVTRGFPLDTQAGDPIDHPHHIGIWFDFENLNGLDFWNNSFAIPVQKKHLYGWIRTDSILKTGSGTKGILSYHANWTDQQKKILLEETTAFEFSGNASQRIIDRVTVLKADTALFFKDAKDGLLGMRIAHALQIPNDKDQKFTDDKGNVTIVKGGTDKIPNGNYLSSEGKMGDSVWSTKGRWCKVYGKMGKDSVSIAIIDHPMNINYPTFWHARGYGLFAANPLGERIFTNNASFKDLRLKQGESITFRYRIIIDEGTNTMTAAAIDRLADEFAKQH
jgi:hypothetical protein